MQVEGRPEVGAASKAHNVEDRPPRLELQKLLAAPAVSQDSVIVQLAELR